MPRCNPPPNHSRIPIPAAGHSTYATAPLHVPPLKAPPHRRHLQAHPSQSLPGDRQNCAPDGARPAAQAEKPHPKKRLFHSSFPPSDGSGAAPRQRVPPARTVRRHNGQSCPQCCWSRRWNRQTPPRSSDDRPDNPVTAHFPASSGSWQLRWKRKPPKSLPAQKYRHNTGQAERIWPSSP